MANETGILVLTEQTEDDALAPISGELIGGARRLVEGGAAGPVVAAVLGKSVDALAKEAIALGADSAVVAEHDLLSEYTSGAYLAAMEQVCREASPAAVLMGQTNVGRDLAPRLAFRLGTAVAMDCVELAVDGGKLMITRPCYGGAARAVNAWKTSPQVATVRAKSQDPLPADASRSGDVKSVAVQIEASQATPKVIERKKAAAEGIRLEDADVVVSGGRGLGGPENFKMIDDLAAALGGAVGASRAVCDLGWRPVSEQVGLTGKVVSPTLYLAVAISGASQHMAGCQGAKNIVAINKDGEANIFKSARFGIVGDYSQVLPPLIEAIKSLKG